MTKYEKARIVGARALQLSMGAPFLLKFTEEEIEAMGYSPIEIAKKEYEAGVIPIIVRMPAPRLVVDTKIPIVEMPKDIGPDKETADLDNF